MKLKYYTVPTKVLLNRVIELSLSEKLFSELCVV